MKTFLAIIFLGIGMVIGLPALAQGIPGQSKELSKRPDPDANLPPSPYAMKPLPELKGVVSWKTLADVKTVKQKDRFVPEFGKGVVSLDKKEVRIQGFMMPLDMGERQARFILAMLPPSCSFCLPGGPEQMVEVQAKTPVKYGFEPVVISGRFAVLKDDAMGLYYRLTDAVIVTAPR
jgi:uncharacterized protein